MKIPRITLVTLGVADLKRSADFYRAVAGVDPDESNEGVVFVQLPGAWLSLYPRKELAKDISPEVSADKPAFSGFTLAYNARSKEEVKAIMETARIAGANVMKEPTDTFWGGYSGYFADPDGYFWEVAWGPMFGFDECGNMTIKKE